MLEDTSIALEHHMFVPGANIKPGPEPALLLLHDTGSSETQLVSAGESILRGGQANLIALRGWYPAEDGYSFLDPDLPQEWKENDFVATADRLSNFLERATQRYELCPSKTVVFGAGTGALLAAALMFTHSEELGGAILFRPRTPFRPVPLPALPAYPILLLNTKKDPRELEQAAEELTDTLAQCGCDIRRVKVPADERMAEKVAKAAYAWYKKMVAVNFEDECES